MPRTAKHLWPEIASFLNLAKAFQKVRAGKRFDNDTMLFYSALEENLFALEDALVKKTWKPKPFREFYITVPKPRKIQAPDFGDRVIHQAVMFHAGPPMLRRFITDSFASIEGRGTHAASRRFRQFMRSASSKFEHPYIIKADIKSYFASIPHDALLYRLERIFADKDLLWFFNTLVRESGYHERGLPIGALTSQWLANLYLDELDHYIKDKLGVKYYVRYMDDFVLIGPDKAWCKEKLALIDSFVQRLELRLNPKTCVLPISQGVDFVGYRHWTDHVLPRKSTVKRFRAQVKVLQRRYNEGKISFVDVNARVQSFVGYMSHCNGYRTTASALEGIVLVGNGKIDSEE